MTEVGCRLEVFVVEKLKDWEAFDSAWWGFGTCENNFLNENKLVFCPKGL